MNTLTLPPLSTSSTPPGFPKSKQLTIVGASGAGKTRFMHRLVTSAGPRAYVLSPIGALIDSSESSIRTAYEQNYCLRPGASPINDLDRLIEMLLHDEFTYLMSVKSARLMGDNSARFLPTRLDKLVKMWQRIFPGNQIMREPGKLMFSTECGKDLVGSIKLSSGERTVLYYIAALLYAPQEAIVFVDEPTMFLHPSLMQPLWNTVEGMRPDCTFVYNTSDAEFLSSRTSNACIWVRSHNAENETWDYTLLSPGSLPDDLFISLIGSRRPVLFIEGDATHSIDAKLYPLVFPGCIVRPLGSCNKVIEATRSFCDLRPMHHLESHGIVDRDRRTEHEVEYLRSKNIMVPEVAEIENIFMLESVIRIMAARRKKNVERIVTRVKRTVINMFDRMHREQVLLHVRHKMKRDLECRSDARVNSIDALEKHLRHLPQSIDVRGYYNKLMNEFSQMIHHGDYAGILRVFNHKPMLPERGVINLLGYKSKEEYISSVLDTLKNESSDSRLLRKAIRACCSLPEEE